MPFYVTIENSNHEFICSENQNVLKAMEQLALDTIPVGCRGGGCGVCRVQVLGNSRYRTGKMSRAEISLDDEQNGICLACKLIPESDLKIRVLGKFRQSLLCTADKD